MDRNRFEFLDGIRGIAALFVVTRHTDEFWNFRLFHNYLAVDIFFILSGFVIAHAYDERLSNRSLSLLHFIRIRLIRLYPVFFLSLVVSAVLLICKTPIRNSTDLTEVVSLIALSAFFIPLNIGSTVALFSINVPYWSLFYELIANFVYALIRPALSRRTEAVIVIASALILGAAAYTKGNLNVGFQSSYPSMIAGVSRFIFGIFMGLMIYRRQVEFANRLGKFISPWAAVTGICAILLCPDLGRFNAVADFIFVTIIFPILIFFASQARTSRLKPILLAFGSISYPIYVFHLPVSELLLIGFRNAVETSAPFSGLALIFLLCISGICMEKYYDIPLRRWLLRRSRVVTTQRLKG